MSGHDLDALASRHGAGHGALDGGQLLTQSLALLDDQMGREAMRAVGRLITFANGETLESEFTGFAVVLRVPSGQMRFVARINDAENLYVRQVRVSAKTPASLTGAFVQFGSDPLFARSNGMGQPCIAANKLKGFFGLHLDRLCLGWGLHALDVAEVGLRDLKAVPSDCEFGIGRSNEAGVGGVPCVVILPAWAGLRYFSRQPFAADSEALNPDAFARLPEHRQDKNARCSGMYEVFDFHDLDRLCLGLAGALFKRAEQLLKRDDAGVWNSVVGELPEPAVANARLLGDQLPIAALLLKFGLNDGLNLWLHDSLSQSFANASSNILRSVW